MKARLFIPALLAVLAIACAWWFLKSRGGGNPAKPETQAAHQTGSQDSEKPPSPVEQSAKKSETPSSPIESFNAWLRIYSASSGSAAKTMLARGEQLARQRRPLMAALIKENPEAALAAAVPRGARASLPAEILALLEEPVDATGDLNLAIACSGGHEGAHPASETWIDAVSGERIWKAHVYGRRTSHLTKSGVSFHGFALDGHLAVDVSPARLLESGEPGYRAGSVIANIGGNYMVFPDMKAYEVHLAAMRTAEDQSDGPGVNYPALPTP